MDHAELRTIGVPAEQHRQLIVDRLHACREAEARAAREYKATDATYTSVRHHLGAEWEATIAAREAEASRLAAFDAQSPVLPTAEQREALDQLGEEVHRIWHHRRASMALKKQIVRLLVKEIIVDLDEARDELVLCIHWSGGHHTDLMEPRRRRKSSVASSDLARIVETLRKVMCDGAIATTLNRGKIRAPSAGSWTGQQVKTFREQQAIAAFSARAKRKHGWLTEAEAANRLSLSAMSVSRLVRSGVLPAEQAAPSLPAVILVDDLDLAIVKQAVIGLKTSHNRPLTHDPNQLSLFPTTNS